MGRVEGVEDEAGGRGVVADGDVVGVLGAYGSEVAKALGIHPQTARKRLRRLEELCGDRLADPRLRFEALLALRTHALRANAG